MTYEAFMGKLGDEMRACAEKLRHFDGPNTEQFIESAKELARMSDIVNHLYEHPVSIDVAESLLRAKTPLAIIGYIWQELRSTSVHEYSIEDALHDIVEKDLLADVDADLEHASEKPLLPDAVETIRQNVSQNQETLTVTQTQKLLCDIGAMLEQAGGEQDQYYLFSHSMGGFAGFCGEPTGVKDAHGQPLHIGDMTCLNGNPEKAQLVFRHSSGDPFPSAEYVKEAGVTRLAGWQESMMFLRSREFDVLSCRDDYRMSRQIASRMHTKKPERGRTGR